MKLTTRIVLLVIGCLLPILAAQVHAQIALNEMRKRQLSDLVLHQAELASADIGSLIRAVSQIGAIAIRSSEVAATEVRCDQYLTALHYDFPEYGFLAVYAADGKSLCGSLAAPEALDGSYRQWIMTFATTRHGPVGPLVLAGTPPARFLPVGFSMPNPATGSGSRTFVAAVNTSWLAKHLQAMRPDHEHSAARATLTVAHRDGVVVARVPEGQDTVGQPIPAWQRLLGNRQSPGVQAITDPEGHTLITAHVPLAPASSGLEVIESATWPDAADGIDQAGLQDLLITCFAASFAVILAWLAGRRFIYQPTEALLLAACKWREGDFSARVAVNPAGAEFSALGQSFSAMAAGMQAREIGCRLQSSALEAQVAERTRELSESNNRLQVEIAGREKTEAALHQSQKLQAVGQLAGGIAHDFNNMLATVLGNLELMERRVSQTEKAWAVSDTERLMRLIVRATGAVQRGSQLTSRLLAFSRRQRLAARATDVNALLRELITLATSTLGRGVQVVPELSEELWPAMVDPSQLEAAILNLCLNARDAMPDGGRLTISTTNREVNCEAGNNGYNGDLSSGSFIRICISDTGIGMTPEVKARAFDPFFTTKGSHGSGLGLSQVYGMARQAAGNAVIDSKPGEGTRITLLLPKAELGEETGTLPSGTTTRNQLETAIPADLVLVVDDDAAVRQVTVEMTRDLGCEVAQAAGGEQALALIDKLSPAPTLILLDYAMPGINGLQLAKAMRERGVAAPIALVTGYAELSEADIADAGLAGLLRKPFTIGELHALLVQLRATPEPLAQQDVEVGLMDT